MKNENQEQEQEGAIPDQQVKDNSLHGFLNERKLQIRILKKMLNQIPVDPAMKEPQEENQKEEQ